MRLVSRVLALSILVLLCLSVLDARAQSTWLGYPGIIPDPFDQYDTLTLEIYASWDLSYEESYCIYDDAEYASVYAYGDDDWSDSDDLFTEDYYDGAHWTFYDSYGTAVLLPITFNIELHVSYYNESYDESYDVPAYAQAPVMPKWCPGDTDRTNLRQEYYSYSVDLSPSCADFSDSRHASYFTFSEINVTGGYSIALVKDGLIASSASGHGLDKWREEYGSARTITSGFRSPAHNASVGGRAQSRHMYGDAADLYNSSCSTSCSSTEWDNMVTAANNADPGFVEDSSGPCGITCTHADWRNIGGGYQ